jgi:hypothetical protein
VRIVSKNNSQAELLLCFYGDNACAEPQRFLGDIAHVPFPAGSLASRHSTVSGKVDDAEND